METFTDYTVVTLASFLAPHDMLSLALTCQRFGGKHGTTTSRSRRLAARESNKRRIREVRQRTETISLMEVAARTVLHMKWSDEEEKALPRRGDESWLGVYQEFLELFRLPLQFDKLVGGSIDYVDSTDKTKVNTKVGVQSTFNTVICNNIMRAGKHTVSFQVTDKDGVSCGIMRPTTNDITSLKKCHPANGDLSMFSLKDYDIIHSNNVDCCLLNTWMGNGLIRERWKKWEYSELMAMGEEQREQAERQHLCQAFHWEGMERTQATNFKIGLVLDLDEGTLDVYKNDRRLGTMRSGLVGEYCWVVTLINSYQDKKVSVTIGR